MIVLVSFILIESCSKPAYNANPTPSISDLYNPYNPNPVNYNWMNGTQFSATVEKNNTSKHWTSDGTGTFTYNYVGGYNILDGYASDGTRMVLEFAGLYPNDKNLDNARMGWKNGTQYLGYYENAMIPSAYIYWTYNALPEVTGTGGVKLVQNDTFIIGQSGYIRGMFFGEATDSVGRTIYVSNGVFNYQKW